MARLFSYGALVASALVVQLTVLDTLPFPGGSAPDLVLLVVVAIALASGPLAGLASGFCGGLALDLAPPAVHSAGAYALVFCLVGYAFGQAARDTERSALLPLTAMAVGAVTGSLLHTVVGVMFGEPDVTWAAARRVLPLTVTYDVLLSPFVLYLVMRLLRWAGHTVADPAAALLRASPTAISQNRPVRGSAPREPKIRPGAGGSVGWIGVGPASGVLAASGRSSGDFGASAGSLRRSPQAGSPRLRFSAPKAQGAQKTRAASNGAGGRASRRGVFAGGSLVGESQVRLHLRPSRGSRLAARTGHALRQSLYGHHNSGPRFGSARSAMAVVTPPRSSKRPRFRRRRFSKARMTRSAAVIPRGGNWLTAWWPRAWRPVAGRPRPVAGRTRRRRMGGLR